MTNLIRGWSNYYGEKAWNNVRKQWALLVTWISAMMEDTPELIQVNEKLKKNSLEDKAIC